MQKRLLTICACRGSWRWATGRLMREPEASSGPSVAEASDAAAHAEAIFRTYYLLLGPRGSRVRRVPSRHRGITDTTRSRFSDEQWANWPPPVVSDCLLRAHRHNHRQARGEVRAAQCAGTGYCLAKTPGAGRILRPRRCCGHWSTASARPAMIRLYAVCKHTNQASARVLEENRGWFRAGGHAATVRRVPN